MFRQINCSLRKDNAPRSWEPATEWEQRLRDITWSFGNDDIRFRHEQWREIFDKQLETNPFSIQSADPLFTLPLGEESFLWTHWLSPDALWERYHTLSQFAVLEGQDLAVTPCFLPAFSVILANVFDRTQSRRSSKRCLVQT